VLNSVDPDETSSRNHVSPGEHGGDAATCDSTASPNPGCGNSEIDGCDGG
jgi:hypothetical protein